MELIAWEPSLAWKLYTYQPFIFSALELFNQAKNIPRGYNASSPIKISVKGLMSYDQTYNHTVLYIYRWPLWVFLVVNCVTFLNLPFFRFSLVYIPWLAQERKTRNQHICLHWKCTAIFGRDKLIGDAPELCLYFVAQGSWGKNLTKLPSFLGGFVHLRRF